MTTPIEDTTMNDNLHDIDDRRRLIAERNAAYDRAMADARRLRQEAYDQFVLDAGAFVRDASQRAARAAHRLAARLRQHAKQRVFEA
jgi:hypothetical protein